MASIPLLRGEIFFLRLATLLCLIFKKMAKKFTDFQAFNDDEDDVEQDESGGKFKIKTNAILYLVDAGRKMFSPPKDGDECDFVKSLKVRLS